MEYNKESKLQENGKSNMRLLNMYYQKCARITYKHNFEKLILATCILIAEERHIVFPEKLKKTCLAIESEIKKYLYLKGKDNEHMHLAAHIFKEVAEHRFPSQTTIENFCIASVGALNLKWKVTGKDETDQIYPKIVHLETQAVCNAKCSFCEYDSLERKGIKMSDENIKKIISDLSLIPASRRVQIQPYKISEPFLDKRLPWIIDEVLEKIPGSNIRLISNGNVMSEEIINWLVDYNNHADDKERREVIKLSISLNSLEKREYEKLMKINFERTIKNITLLHEKLSESQGRGLSVSLTRVSTNPKGDLLFAQKCAKLFPRFKSSLLKLNDWFSYNEDSKNQLIEMGVPLKSFKRVGCSRWRDLSISADGSLALCCMDAGIEKLNLGMPLKIMPWIYTREKTNALFQGVVFEEMVLIHAIHAVIFKTQETS